MNGGDAGGTGGSGAATDCVGIDNGSPLRIEVSAPQRASSMALRLDHDRRELSLCEVMEAAVGVASDLVGKNGRALGVYQDVSGRPDLGDAMTHPFRRVRRESVGDAHRCGVDFIIDVEEHDMVSDVDLRFGRRITTQSGEFRVGRSCVEEHRDPCNLRSCGFRAVFIGQSRPTKGR